MNSVIEQGRAASIAAAAGIATLGLVEHFGGGHLRYAFECVGPAESDRRHLIALRERLLRAPTAREYFAIHRDVLAVPLERKWLEDRVNTIMTAGGNDMLTQYFKGSSWTAAWYVGLIDNSGFTAIAAGDTAASHSGWSEGVPYSNSTRPSFTLGTASSKSIDNSASKASYTINATATLNGAFAITNSTKSGTTGTLYSASSFGSTRSVVSADTVNVQITQSV